MFSKIVNRFVLVGLLAFAGIGWAQEPFLVSDIRVEGLQRISPDAVFAALPLNVGDAVSSTRLADAARALFRTGNFDDI